MKWKVVNYSNQQCDDAIFGEIYCNNGNWQWVSVESGRKTALKVTKEDISETNLDETKNKASLVLILESPHKNEYDNNGAPIRPANGTSGKNIYNHLCDVLNNPNTGNKFNNANEKLQEFLSNHIKNTLTVWVVNAIQYQCSMGIVPINHMIKESNWIDEWHSSRNTLVKRLNNFMDNSVCSSAFYINLCTIGNYIPMKTIVGESIKPVSNNNYCEGPHPSSWTRRNAVKFE